MRRPHHTARSGAHRLGLLSTLICHETSNWRNLKTLGFCFHLDGKHLQREAFGKRYSYNNHVSFLPMFSSNPKPKWTVIVEILNCFGAVWTVNMMRFHWSLRFQFPPRIWLVSWCIAYHERVERERERSKSLSCSPFLVSQGVSSSSLDCHQFRTSRQATGNE